MRFSLTDGLVKKEVGREEEERTKKRVSIKKFVNEYPKIKFSLHYNT